MSDLITSWNSTVVHHGPANDRAYLLKLGEENPAKIAGRLVDLASEQGYSKVVAKVPRSARNAFESAGYRSEASVPGYFQGTEDMDFMTRYFSSSRSHPEDPEKIEAVLRTCEEKWGMLPPQELNGAFTCRIAGPEDADEMAAIYKTVFASYPFPIHDPAYLRKTMEEKLVVYFGIWEGARLIALSSAELDKSAASAEMTDFATRPDCRGGGFAAYLLRRMEEEVPSLGVKTLFTIARALSFPMNITFAKLGYRFGGTLIRNTDIGGSLESMNIWHKNAA